MRRNADSMKKTVIAVLVQSRTRRVSSRKEFGSNRLMTLIDGSATGSAGLQELLFDAGLRVGAKANCESEGHECSERGP